MLVLEIELMFYIYYLISMYKHIDIFCWGDINVLFRNPVLY